MTDAVVSAVLPLRTLGRAFIHQFGRTQILLTSLAGFAAPGTFKDIFIIVPARERALGEALRRKWGQLPLVIIDEEAILPVLRSTGAWGWYRQQLIKLRAAELSSTEFFVTFDADVILCKPLDGNDLVRGGKALLQKETRSYHPDWWAGSARLLGLPLDPEAEGMSVTPAVLSKSICKRLFTHLEDRFGEDWPTALLRRTSWGWTEYTLYFLIAEHYGMLNSFHFTSANGADARMMGWSNVWFERDFAKWNVEACFDPATSGFFSVMQGNTGISPSAVAGRLRNHLEVTRSLAPSLFHRARSLWEDATSRRK